MSKDRPRPWHDPTPLPGFEPEWMGQFDSKQDWINHATRALTGLVGNLGEEINAICVDSLGRRCHIGGDFQRAEDEGTYPIRYFVTGTVSPLPLTIVPPPEEMTDAEVTTATAEHGWSPDARLTDLADRFYRSGLQGRQLYGGLDGMTRLLRGLHNLGLLQPGALPQRQLPADPAPSSQEPPPPDHDGPTPSSVPAPPPIAVACRPPPPGSDHPTIVVEWVGVPGALRYNIEIRSSRGGILRYLEREGHSSKTLYSVKTEHPVGEEDIVVRLAAQYAGGKSEWIEAPVPPLSEPEPSPEPTAPETSATPPVPAPLGPLQLPSAPVGVGLTHEIPVNYEGPRVLVVRWEPAPEEEGVESYLVVHGRTTSAGLAWHAAYCPAADERWVRIRNPVDEAIEHVIVYAVRGLDVSPGSGVQVRYQDGLVSSGQTGTPTNSLLDVQGPPAPKRLRASALQPIEGLLHVVWDRIDGAGFYEVELCERGSHDWVPVQKSYLPEVVLPIGDKSLTGGVHHRVRVRSWSRNALAHSDWSEELGVFL